MHRDAGVTIVELMVAVAIIGMLAATASLWLRPAEAPLQSGTVLLEGYLRQVRARALATTSAYRISAPEAGRLAAEYAESCAGVDWTDEPDFDLELPEEVGFDDTAWTLCFSSRGVSTANLVLTLEHPRYGSRQVEVLLGGTTRVLP